jgi:GNAT superfamily N-acetyltransferase
LTASEILARFDTEIRKNPPHEPNVRVERIGKIVRLVGPYNCIVFSDLGRVDADAAIAEQVAFIRTSGADVEWKVYGHDLPLDLGRRLHAAGFIADEPETLMAFDLHHDLPAGPMPPGAEIRRIVDERGLADLAAVTAAASGRDEAWMSDVFMSRLHDPTLGLYVVYADERPIAAARLEMPENRTFAGLWGGSTLPAFRGRGLFRQLVAVRAQEARRRGYRYLNVDARETSRAILGRLGFIALTGVTGWIMKAAQP